MSEKQKNEKKGLEKDQILAWDKYNDEDMKNVFELGDRYKDFISKCKIERECVDETIRIAKENGYEDLKEKIKNNEKLSANDKVYYNNMGKSIILYNIGKGSIRDGINILGSHLDSPRLDLKPNPLYESENLAMFKTHYYGGVKKYQWVTIPLAIHGVVVKKDMTSIPISIGEDDNDPVFGVSDLLIHLAADQMKKEATKVIEGESLNLCIGSIPVKDEDEKERVKKNVLRLLNEKYGMEEEDFISAELEVVPAGKARDYGFDRSMVMGYGHDDKVCAYAAIEAFMDMENVEKTATLVLTDKEEIGSVGATGAHAKFFENSLAELMDLCGEYTELNLRRAMQNSKMLSADVSAGFDPNYPSVMEKSNCTYISKGITFNKYTGARGKGGCSDANAEFVAYIRKIMDKHDVMWQLGELGKVDQGGGGTIAYLFAQYGMEVIDCGVSVHNMHAPWEIISKADLYETYKGYKAFLIES